MRCRSGAPHVELAAAILLASAAGCAPDEERGKSGEAEAPRSSPRLEVTDPSTFPEPFPGEQFTWLPDAFGGWRHVAPDSDDYRMPDVMCGGVVLFDADGDADLDVFLVNGGVWNDVTPGVGFPGHGLLINESGNEGGLRFRDVAREAGVLGEDGSFCNGATAGDFDGDGDEDLYVTALGRNFLYRNDGARDGVPRFTERAAELGVRGDGRWGTSACFLDADRDGRLDLYVVNYLAFTVELNRRLDCGGDTGKRDYCSPKEFVGEQDWFFRNEGGRFRECALEVGLQATQPLKTNAKGLGVVPADVDDDGDVDLYVANDGCANFLFLNDGAGRFVEEGAARGCAYSEDGASQAGMGVDAGDFDGDGDLDLWVVHLDLELNAMYRNDEGGWFVDDVKAAGLAAMDRGEVGFGTDLFDYDHDGDLDLAIANGHVLRHIHEVRGTIEPRQSDQLLENDGAGRYRLVEPRRAGAYFTVSNIARGLASGDLDGDGDLDLVITPRAEPAVLLRNNEVAPGERARALLLDLRSGPNGTTALGARVTLAAGGRRQLGEVVGASSYQSRCDTRLHFGLGGASHAEDVAVRWPDGTVQELGRLEAGFEYVVAQGGAARVRRELTGR